MSWGPEIPSFGEQSVTLDAWGSGWERESRGIGSSLLERGTWGAVYEGQRVTGSSL